MIHVFCSRWGDKYPVEYVNNLYFMVRRHLPMEFKFYVQCSTTRGLHPKIEQLPFLEDLPNSTPEKMWNSPDHVRGLPRLWDRPKMNYWKPGGWGIKGQKIAFDLDVIIQNDLTPLIELHQDKILFGRSWWHDMDLEKTPRWIKCHSAKINGGCFMWNDEQGKPLWNDAKKNAEKIYHIYTGGTDNWLSEKHINKFDYIPSSMYYSYNRGCEWPDDIKMHTFREDKIMCVFNCDVGNPLHQELHDAAKVHPWVSKFWH